MKVVLRNRFFRDQTEYCSAYLSVSETLGVRFEAEVSAAIEVIVERPTSAGHPIPIISKSGQTVRRRNLRIFPFFILYIVHKDRIVLSRLCALRSDPKAWAKGL